MLDATQDATATITRLISTGISERDLLAVVARCFPELTRTEFVAVLQDATAAAEKHAAGQH